MTRISFLPAVEGAVVVISDLPSLSLNESVPTKLSLVIPAVAGLTKGGPRKIYQKFNTHFLSSFNLNYKDLLCLFRYSRSACK